MNNTLLSTYISPNDLSVRAYKCLRNAGVNTIGDLIGKTDVDLLKCRNFGKKSLRDVEKYLARLNLSLGGSPLSAADCNIDYGKLVLPISEFNLSVRSSKCLKKARISLIADLVRKTELELLKYRNFGQKSLREINKLLTDMGLRLGLQVDESILAEHINKKLIEGNKDTFKSKISFSDCINYINSNMIQGNSIKVFYENKRIKNIIESRLAEDKNRTTLKELGKRFSLTRERVRQLEKKAGDMLIASFDFSYRHFITKFNDEINNSDGIKVFEYDKTVLKSTGFKLFNIALGSINPNVEFDYNFEAWIGHKSKKLFNKIDKYFRKNCKAGNPYTKQDMDGIVDKCISNLNIHSISASAFLSGIANQWFKSFGGYYFYKFVSKPEVIALLIKEHYPQGIAIYRDIKSFINVCNTNGLQELVPRNERAFIGMILRSQELVLWDWGVYIHRSRISIDESLLNSIRDWLIEQFDIGITRLSIWAAFSKFKEDCEKSNIPNEHALYSCLKIKYRNEFLFPKDPIICSLKARKRLNKCEILENYLLERKEGAELWKIEETLGLKRFQLDQIESDKILAWGVRGNRKLIHIDNIEFDKDDFKVIAESLAGPIRKYRHISVIKVYQDNFSINKKNEIPGAYALYSFLSCTLKNKYYFPRYPYILKKDHSIENDGNFSFNDIVHDYFKIKNAPLSYDDLYAYFVKERGYPRSMLLNIAYLCDRVVMYTRNVYILLDLLNWTDEKEVILRSVILEKLSRNAKEGFSFVAISELLAENKLPRINESIDVKWQSVLLRELLGRFEFLSFSDNRKDALVSLCENETVDNMQPAVG